jgi:hypothetical protein
MTTIGRNDPCWCGSGKKYKKCHWQADQRAAAERAAAERAQRERLESVGHPSDAELRRRYERMAGQAPPPGPLPAEVRDSITELWQHERLGEQAREALEPERELWASYFEERPEEFEEVANELARDSFFDTYTLTERNVRKVRSELGSLPEKREGEEMREYVRRAIEITLDEGDRDMFYAALLSRLPDLVEEGNLKAAYVIDTSAARVQDPGAPISPFLRDVVPRSLTD